jgi:hypothetical protein
VLVWIEAGLCIVAILVALIAPQFGASWFEKWESKLGDLAERKRLAVIAVGLLALGLRAGVLPVEPIPVPGIHDEFSYLLMADTFAHRRIANPTHPMWIHFETFHVIQKPSYVSMFYPAQGLFLAAGQVIAGHPFWGVWLSAGLMCAAICWMLQGYLPPTWALLGGLLAIIRLGSFSYWANSYWGGAPAAIGGALVLGALPRIKREQHVHDAVLMGLGLAILANSRPFEGLFFSIPIGIALLVWILGTTRPPRRVCMARIMIPLGLVLVVTTGAMLYYFWRTTGSPFQTPYMLNVKAYNPVPYFPWRSLKSVPIYHHTAIKNFYMDLMLEQYQSARQAPIVLALTKSVLLWAFFLGPVLTLPLVMLGVVLPYGMSYKEISRVVYFLLAVCAVSFFALLLPIYYLPHYTAPLTSAIYALVLLAMRRVRRWEWRGKATGLFIVRAVPAICIILILLRVTAGPLHLPLRSHGWSTILSDQLLARACVQSQMNKDHGKQLLLVRYSSEHNPGNEWVYNGADIDGSKVIWARDMGKEKNQELLDYFPTRQVWLVEADKAPVKISPYSQVVRDEAPTVKKPRHPIRAPTGKEPLRDDTSAQMH